LPQHRRHANPPTLLLRLQGFVDSLEAAEAHVSARADAQVSGGGAGGDSAAVAAAAKEAHMKRKALERQLGVARRLWPRLKRWHGWYVRTQAGEVPSTYRWRGRDPNDAKLNAMTLSSGLDDFPRATHPTDAERHVDLLCWMAFASRLLSRLAARLGHDAAATRYRAEHAAQLEALEAHHWNEALGAYCDHGLHSNSGSFKTHYLVKCGTADGSSSIEHDLPNPNRPNCPNSHPRFLFPLGDGHGGLLTRERFVPAKLKKRWVEHLGYVALFPLMLRLLPPTSLRLPHLIELLRDPNRLWSPYGIRSLSKADAWYGRENAPGDAPYWRGPIWVNLNYLCLAGLHHYAAAEGPSQQRAAEVYAELRDNLVGNMVAQWKATGYFWEQYDPDSGAGQRTHPFNGWSSLALLALAEIY